MAKYEDNLTTTRNQETKISSPTAPVTSSSTSSWRDKFKKYGSDNTETAKPVTVPKPVEVPKSVSSSKPIETSKPAAPSTTTVTKVSETPKPEEKQATPK